MLAIEGSAELHLQLMLQTLLTHIRPYAVENPAIFGRGEVESASLHQQIGARAALFKSRSRDESLSAELGQFNLRCRGLLAKRHLGVQMIPN